MKIDRIKTEDNQGNTYDKLRIVGNESNAVICLDGKNKHYKGQANISVRKGKSVFGTEVVVQLEAQKLESEYDASSGFRNHIEIYFTEEEARELFTALLLKVGGKIPFNPDDWCMDKCEKCGGHLYCQKCGKFTWHKETKDDIS